MATKIFNDKKKFENPEITVPLPEGPYLTIPQHQEADFKKNPISFTKESTWSRSFSFPFCGFVVVAIDPMTGEGLRCAANFDSSD